MRRFNHLPIQDFTEIDVRSRRFLMGIFKSKPKVRSGAMLPEEVKNKLIKIGKGKKVKITRLAYDGTPEDPPIEIKIIDIGHNHFTGKIINVERSISESQSEKLIYIKGGGGTLDFYYTDGDIMSMEEDIDEKIVEQRNIEEIREILDALDLKEEITISYYDKNQGGVINGVGVLEEKNMETLDFKVTLSLINDIKLKKDKTIVLNLNNDKILDLEVII
jgi:hypothetical protein